MLHWCGSSGRAEQRAGGPCKNTYNKFVERSIHLDADVKTPTRFRGRGSSELIDIIIRKSTFDAILFRFSPFPIQMPMEGVFLRDIKFFRSVSGTIGVQRYSFRSTGMAEHDRREC